MSRSPLFASIHRALTIARSVKRDGCRRSRASRSRARASTRQRHAAAGVSGCRSWDVLAQPPRSPRSRRQSNACAHRRRRAPRPSVGIVGAGLAGLACADALADRGIVASVYEAGLRTGGRCWSLRGFFPQQVGERGGEFIDTTHKTMLRYAKRFGLALEDVTKKAGDTTYFFDGQHVPEAVIVDEFREFVAVMRADLRRLSSEVTASSPTADDVILDNTSLADYLDGAQRGGRGGRTGGAGRDHVGVSGRVWTGDRRAELSQLPDVHPRRSPLEVHSLRRVQRRALSPRRRERRHRRRADAVPATTGRSRQNARGREADVERRDRAELREPAPPCDARHRRPGDAIQRAAECRAASQPGHSARAADGHQYARIRRQCEVAGGIRRSPVDRSGQQRDRLLGSHRIIS